MSRPLQLDRSGPWIGAVGLVVVLWYALASALYAPWWGVGLALLLLVPEVVLVRRWAVTRPRWCMAVPVVGMALIGALAYVGATAWGWE
jgi:hypothetical protein